MGLKESMQHLKTLLNNLSKDLEKAAVGNKTAAQRVRTGSLVFAKVAKMYRKESVATEKKEGGKRKAAKSKSMKKSYVKGSRKTL